VLGWTPSAIVALILCLLPLLAFGFAEDRVVRTIRGLPLGARLLAPSLLGVPYWLAVDFTSGIRWIWLAFYITLPVLVALALWSAGRSDPQQRGNWRDFAVLLALGLAVDLRWLEPAWPAHLSLLSKLILLDAGLYGFCVIRPLINVGFDLRVRGKDMMTGLRELAFYAPIAIPLGIGLGFLHWHVYLPKLGSIALTWIFTFLLIAIPEEIYFRGWIQNLLERRLGRSVALGLTAIVFGLSHFNKRDVHFNWRYVLLATFAGIFYGRAWRKDHRIAASSITHACVDAIWSLWLR
jgi:uncharacterized protein